MTGEAKQAATYRCTEQGNVLAADAGTHGGLGHTRHLRHLYDMLISGGAHWGPPCMHVRSWKEPGQPSSRAGQV